MALVHFMDFVDGFVLVAKIAIAAIAVLLVFAGIGFVVKYFKGHGGGS